MTSAFKKWLWSCWERLAKLAAPSYIVGEKLSDALRISRELASQGISTVFCYWNDLEESPQQITAKYLDAVDAARVEKMNSYISLKVPALNFNRQCLNRILDGGINNNIHLHFDSHAPEAADDTFDVIKGWLSRGVRPGCTLPGRWLRSLRDCDWAVENGLPVRVVKGQWDDQTNPDKDLRKGFLAVIDKLAGRARHVAVATHDIVLAKEALGRLLNAGTPCELELLYGLPLEPSCRTARAMGVHVRLYLPYGHGWIPYCLSQVKGNPRILWWVCVDMLRRSLPARGRGQINAESSSMKFQCKG